ncbi:MAG: LysM peptidoglycan-binding domain-containing protein, partial [Dehalococcoidia bacterium]|nr:LysM peptidoglycan-binding domain-containing protein [Dehalococcoidia bacterium]
MKRTSALTGLAALLAGVILVACGGGGGEEAGDGPGQRITDPALVPTSTPMQDPVLYKISNDTITTEGGASATVAPGTAATPRAGRKTYTVESGDTCSGIAA